jgi:hypothetical protein
MARRKRPATTVSDDNLIRDWMRDNLELQVEVGYDIRADRFIAVVVDLSRGRAYVGDGGMSTNITEAVLAAINEAEQSR